MVSSSRSSRSRRAPTRAGRLQKIAFDSSPISAEKPDLDARLGWLLAMSRHHHPDPRFREGRRFVEALREHGPSPSRSLISRWESGEIPVSYAGLMAYEQTLGMPDGHLSSTAGFLRVSVPGVRPRLARPPLDPGTREFSNHLDELIELAEADAATTVQWLDLGWHLSSVPLVYLRSGTWESLAHRLVGMIPRGVFTAYRHLIAALMNIAEVPRSHDFFVEAISDYLATPHVQVVNNPIGQLDQLPTRAAAELVLNLLEDPPEESTYAVIVWATTMKLRRGHFTEAERARVEMFVLEQWRANPQRAADDLAQLLAELPTPLQETLTEAAAKVGRKRLGYVLEHGESIPAVQAENLAASLADSVHKNMTNGDYTEDRMLPRLIREALFHRSSEQRKLSGWLLAASPFAVPLNDQLLQLLAITGLPASFRTRVTGASRYLSTDQDRHRLGRLLDDPQVGVAVGAGESLGHLQFRPTTDQLVRAGLQPSDSAVGRARLYALGMTGSEVLTLLRDSPQAPAWQRNAAQWWIGAGRAIAV